MQFKASSPPQTKFLLLSTFNIISVTHSAHIWRFGINVFETPQYQDSIAKNPVINQFETTREGQYMNIVKSQRKHFKYKVSSYYQNMMANGQGRLTPDTTILPSEKTINSLEPIQHRNHSHNKKKARFSKEDFKSWYESNEDEIQRVMLQYQREHEFGA